MAAPCGAVTHYGYYLSSILPHQSRELYAQIHEFSTASADYPCPVHIPMTASGVNG